MTLIYNIDTIDPLVLLNNMTYDFSSWVSFPGTSGITVKSVILDPTTGQLVIEIDYS